MLSKADQIVRGLGGAGNIVDDVESCATRLHVRLVDRLLVDRMALTRAGAFGLAELGGVLQVVVGIEAVSLADDINDLLECARADSMEN